jgi:hypothetical protein
MAGGILLCDPSPWDFRIRCKPEMPITAAAVLDDLKRGAADTRYSTMIIVTEWVCGRDLEHFSFFRL